MTSHEQPVASDLRRRAVSWLALATLLVVPLSGCMSSGASSFASSTDRAEAPQVLPLNVADDPAMPTAPLEPGAQPGMQAAASSQYAAPAQYPAQVAGQPQALTPDYRRDTRLASVGDPVLPANADYEGTSDLQALIDAEERQAVPANRQISALTPSSATPSALSPSASSPYMPAAMSYRYDDPAEMAAQARIPGLYASIDHGECKGGWGPKPKMINATKVTQGEPYYMEMRLRHTPMLPVGHVYIAYGRLGPDGQPLDEKLIMLAPLGGYGGAAVAAAVPMPGIMKPYGDDCIVQPHAAYRLSLTAQRFEQLLLEIERQKAKKPAYALFAYNCNHFMSDVAKSVGILPPKNIYEPSLKYFYSMMDRNEGRKVPRTAEELRKEQIRVASAARAALQ